MDKYYVLYCNYAGSFYEIGIGKKIWNRLFFDHFREKYGYDKDGNSYDEDITMDLVVYEFDAKEETINFLADCIGAAVYSSPEDRKQKQLKFAEEIVDDKTKTRLF